MQQADGGVRVLAKGGGTKEWIRRLTEIHLSADAPSPADQRVGWSGVRVDQRWKGTEADSEQRLPIFSLDPAGHMEWSSEKIGLTNPTLPRAHMHPVVWFIASFTWALLPRLGNVIVFPKFGGYPMIGVQESPRLAYPQPNSEGGCGGSAIPVDIIAHSAHSAH